MRPAGMPSPTTGRPWYSQTAAAIWMSTIRWTPVIRDAHGRACRRCTPPRRISLAYAAGRWIVRPSHGLGPVELGFRGQGVQNSITRSGGRACPGTVSRPPRRLGLHISCC